MNSRVLSLVGIAILCAVLIAALASCGGNGGGGSKTGIQTGTVTTMVSDPATCAAPNGPYSHVWITVADVKASTNANAGDNDSSFVDLTPNMTPVQVDLLATPPAECFLATLMQGATIPAGQYQQIRLILLDNNTNTQPANNQCGPAVNCVVLTSDGSTHTLQLSSESQTGVKIPSGQIAGGKFTVPAGGSADLDIDFNACESIVQQGAGQYRLKPVLHAGEVSLTGSAITGTVVDSVTQSAIQGGTVIVALEQKDASGVDRVLMQANADANGNFQLCPVSQGTYDIVASAVNGSGVVYAATITTGVQPGATLSKIPLIATSTAAGTLTGQVNTAGASAPTSADVQVSALQSANGTLFTVPLAVDMESSETVTTIPSGTCPNNSDCGTYTLDVPVANPNIGASGGPYTQASGAVNYTIDGLAFVPNTPSTPDCSPQDMQVAANNVVAGANPTAAPLNFTGCQ